MNTSCKSEGRTRTVAASNDDLYRWLHLLLASLVPQKTETITGIETDSEGSESISLSGMSPVRLESGKGGQR